MDQEDSISTKLAVIARDIQYIGNEVADIKTNMSSNFVTDEKFSSLEGKVKWLIQGVFWLLGVMAVGLVGAFLKLVLK